MPVSGSKEPGIIARQFGESSAGVPIKKRWFHLVRPPSPAPQTISPPLETDLQQKGQSNLKSESSSKAAASWVSDGDAIKTPPHEQNRENCADRNVNLVQAKISPLEVNLKEPSFSVASSAGSEIDGGKLEVADKTASQTMAENIQVQLAMNEALLNKQEEIQSEKELRKKDPLKKQVSTELLLAPTESMVSDAAGQNCLRFQKEEEKLDPQLWNLGLNKGKSDLKTDSIDSELKIDLCANRSYWDLNTTMERWDNLAMVHGSSAVSGLNLAESHDIKPVICSSEKVISGTKDILVDQGKQVVVRSELAAQLFNSCPLVDQHNKTEELLHLSLNTASTLHPGSSQRPPSLSSKLDLGSISNLNLSEKRVSQSNNKSSVGSNPVKSEPSDDSNQKDLNEAKVGNEKAKTGIVKTEPFEDCLQESKRPSNVDNLGLVGHGAVKLEPVGGSNQETMQAMGETSQKSELLYKCMRNMPINGDLVPCSDSSACPTYIRSVSGPQELPTRLGLYSGVEASSHSEFPTYTNSMPSGEKVAQVATENVSAIGSHLVSESSGPAKNSKVDENLLNETEGFGAANTKPSRLTLDSNPFVGSNGNGEGAESGEEKISLSDDMQDECSSDSDVESNGDDAVGDMNSKDKHHDGEDDDYEDGEVREPLVESSSQGDVYKDGQSEQVRHDDNDGSDMDISGCSGSDHAASLSHVEDKEAKIEDHGETVVSCGTAECADLKTSEKHEQNGSLEQCSGESLPSGAASGATGIKKSIKYTRRKPLDHSGKEAGLKGCDKELLPEGASSARQGATTVNNQGGNVSKQENVEDAKEKSVVLSKVETLGSSVELTKDVNISRGIRSRIINLARTFSGSSSSGRMRSIPGRPLPSRTERERLTDVAVYEDKLLPRGIRDDNPMDGGQKFERQRNQDQPIGGTGSGFMHGRGRIDKHLESSRGDWESDRNFGLDNFNGPTGFRFSRPKNSSGVSPAKVECNGLLVARDGSIVGGGRGGRKQLNNELPTFRHPPRRRSPPGREGHVSHGVQMVRRPPRDSSPDRCLVGGGPDLIGLRHEEKFIRGPPEDMMDPMFTCPQPRYQRVGDPFVRRDRSFSPIQRRGPLHVTRIRSKSPPGPRTRSPGPWSSPRRRSPDAFGQHELVHRRTSPFYRIGRMRSPNQTPCFPEDMVARRHASPPYISQLPSDMREMGPAREHDHPRFIHSRSPSGRVLPRSTRRFDIMDPRQEIDRDEYFGGHIPSGRFHELRGDGIADDRRILDRRGVVRSFRPPFNGSDVENFQFHEGGPRPYRFSPETDAEFHVRGNLRVREFERRVKSRPDNAPRRNRSIEEQEENYRHGEQGWHDAGFEDVSRLKRRRF